MKYSHTMFTKTDTKKKDKPERPVKKEGYNHAKLTARNNRRRREAEIRQDAYDSLTHAEKVARATNRGGCVKELARLTKAKKKS